jgi:EAL domain-containing protein (putative c-di-GMP-specific phosphodiesterase class I)
MATVYEINEDGSYDEVEDDADMTAAGAVEPVLNPGKPLDPANLTVLQEGLAMADVSTTICRQPVCAVVQGQGPRIVFHEVYTSIESLRRMLMPNVNLHANRWLFQALTQYLDHATIDYLSTRDDAQSSSSFSMNLNVSTLQSPEFLELADSLSEKIQGSLIVELQLVDVYADLASFFRVRDTLRARGFKFCLDGIDHLTLPLIDRQALGFDLVKLIWQPELHEKLQGKAGDALRKAAKKNGPDRMILARCDSSQALEAGRSMGIALYQGRLIDGLCDDFAARESTARVMTTKDFEAPHAAVA